MDNLAGPSSSKKIFWVNTEYHGLLNSGFDCLFWQLDISNPKLFYYNFKMLTEYIQQRSNRSIGLVGQRPENKNKHLSSHSIDKQIMHSDLWNEFRMTLSIMNR